MADAGEDVTHESDDREAGVTIRADLHQAHRDLREHMFGIERARDELLESRGASHVMEIERIVGRTYAVVDRSGHLILLAREGAGRAPLP